MEADVTGDTANAAGLGGGLLPFRVVEFEGLSNSMRGGGASIQVEQLTAMSWFMGEVNAEGGTVPSGLCGVAVGCHRLKEGVEESGVAIWFIEGIVGPIQEGEMVGALLPTADTCRRVGWTEVHDGNGGGEDAGAQSRFVPVLLWRAGLLQFNLRGCGPLKAGFVL